MGFQQENSHSAVSGKTVMYNTAQRPFAQSAHAHTHKLADRVNKERDSVVSQDDFNLGRVWGGELKYCFMTVMPNFTLCYAVCEGDCARLRQTGGERATEWSWEQCSIKRGKKKKTEIIF